MGALAGTTTNPAPPVATAATLRVYSLQPSWALLGQPFSIVIRGSGFRPGTKIRIGYPGQTLTPRVEDLRIDSPEQITVRLSPVDGKTTAYYPVQVYAGSSANATYRPGLTLVSPRALPFMDLCPEIRRALRLDYRTRNLAPDEDGARATFELNSEGVPFRCELLLEALRAELDVASLKDLDVLDIGTGYGSMALYLTIVQRPRSYVAGDIDSSFFAVSEHIRQSNPGLFLGLAFRHEDMRHLSLCANSVDVVICHNAINYLTDRRSFHSALSEFRRVLRPGGALVVYGPNKWFPREAFTRIYGLQFLPRALAHRISLRWGNRRGYLDIRLFSPLELWTGLFGAGFQRIRVHGPSEIWHRLRTFPVLFWPYTYTLAAKPGR